MLSEQGRGRLSVRRHRWWQVGFALLLGCGVAGCDTLSSPSAVLSSPTSGTVAFESIDGLPEPAFRKLVQNLSDEANTRQIAVVSREGVAQYRVRGYASAEIERKQTKVVWVWDVYDADQNRVVRLSGEEKSASAARGWAAADDATLQRMARDGLGQLATFLGKPASTPAPAAPATAPAAPPSAVVASNDDFSPESAGIFRFIRDLVPSAEAAPAVDAGSVSPISGPVPMPRPRPRNLGLTAHAALSE